MKTKLNILYIVLFFITLKNLKKSITEYELSNCPTKRSKSIKVKSNNIFYIHKLTLFVL
jgi:hypothetical protein